MSDESTLLRWSAMAPWLSTPEWANFAYVDRSSISRKMNGSVEDPRWREDRIVLNREFGYLERPRKRYVLSMSGLDLVFPHNHIHPGPDRHTHDPDDVNYCSTHEHPT